MTRRTRLAPLVTAAFLLWTAVPEAPLLVHRHAGGGLAHVHLDEDGAHDHGEADHHPHEAAHHHDHAAGPGLGHPDDDGVAHAHARHPVVLGARPPVVVLAPGVRAATAAPVPAAEPLVRLFGIAHPRGPPSLPAC